MHSTVGRQCRSCRGVLPSADDGYPTSLSGILANWVTIPLFVALAAVIALFVGAISSSFLSATYVGTLGAFIGLAVVIFLSITSRCPHCGTRNLRR
jgi:hypothetical protein